MPKLKEKKETFSTALWVLLLIGAGIIDVLQVVLDATIFGIIISIALDFIVGIILFTIFFFGGIRNKKVLFSVLAGVGLGVFSVGAMPSWIADVGFAWLMTDGANKINAVPVVGKTASKVIKATNSISSGKLPPKLG